MDKVKAIANSNLKGLSAELVVVDEVHELPGFPADDIAFRVNPMEGRVTGSPNAVDWAAPIGTPIPNRELVVDPKGIQMTELDSLPKGTAVLSNTQTEKQIFGHPLHGLISLKEPTSVRWKGSD